MLPKGQLLRNNIIVSDVLEESEEVSTSKFPSCLKKISLLSSFITDADDVSSIVS